MADDLKKVGLIFKADGTVDFVKSLKNINSELRTNYSNFKLVQAQWDEGAKSSEKLAAKQEYLAKAYDISSKKVTTLKVELDELAKAENRDEEAIQKKTNELTNAETQSARYKKQLENTNAEIKAGTADLKDYANNLEKSADSMVSAGKKMSVLSAAYVAGVGLASKAAIDFESAFAGVEKTVDGTSEQMLILKDGIRNMAKELPASTTEIAAVSEAAGQLGIKTESILDFTKVMIDLGESTNMGAEEAAITLAKFANITQMSQGDFSKLGSVIVGLGNNFATTEKDIAAMGLNLAAAGKQVGMTEPQIMAMATTLSSLGVEAQAGGTAFSKVMINMQLAMETGGKPLENFAKVAGVTVDEFTRLFKEDATQAIQAFIDGLAKGGAEGESTIKILNDMEITEVRLRDALLRTAGASDILRDATSLSTKAWDENTALAKEAGKRYETTESKMRMLGNEVNDLGISFGELLLPMIRGIVSGISGLIKTINNLSAPMKMTILVIGGLVAAIGPLLIVSGMLAGSVSKIIILYTTFKEASSGVSLATKAMSMSMTALPFLAVVAGVAAVVAGFSLWKDHLESSPTQKAKRDIQEYNDEMKALEKTKQDAVDKGFSEIEYYRGLQFELSGLVDSNGAVTDATQARVDRVGQIVGTLNEHFGTEMTLNDNLVSSYQESTEKIIAEMDKRKAQILLDAHAETYAKAIEKEKELETAYGASKKRQDKIDEYRNAQFKKYHDEGLDENDSHYNAMQDAIKKFGNIYVDELVEQENAMLKNQKVVETYNAAEIEMQKGNMQGVLDILNAKSYEVSKIQQYDTRTLRTALNEAEALQEANDRLMLVTTDETAKAKYKMLSEQYATEAEQLRGQLDLMKTVVIDKVPEFAEAFKTQGIEGINALASSNKEAYNAALSFAQEMVNGASDKRGALAMLATQYGDEFVVSLQNKYPTLKTAGIGVSQSAKEGVASVSDQWIEAGKHASDGFAMGLIGNVERVKAMASKVGLSAYDSLKTSMQIASPSKLTKKAGGWFGEGLAIGIKDTIAMVKKVSTKLGTTAIDSVSDLNVGSEINKELTKNILADGTLIASLGNELLVSNNRSATGMSEEAKDLIDYNKLANIIHKQFVNSIDGISVKIDKREIGKVVGEVV